MILDYFYDIEILLQTINLQKIDFFYFFYKKNYIWFTMSMIHLVNYVDQQSANIDSLRDFDIGETTRQVGNSSTLKFADRGDVALITCKGGKKFKFVRLGNRIPDADPRCHAWEREGGKLWKYNFEIDENLTNTIDRSKLMERFIRQECQERGKINRIFHPCYVNVGYSEIYEILLTRIQSGDSMQDPV